MTELGAALEATALAEFLKVSRWVYPLVNAFHILGLALLIGSVVPMDLCLAGLRRRANLPVAVALLRPVAAIGLAVALGTGFLLFMTQASDYLQNGWFRTKMALLALALLNVVLHPRLVRLPDVAQRRTAVASLALWPSVLVCGRMIGYS